MVKSMGFSVDAVTESSVRSIILKLASCAVSRSAMIVEGFAASAGGYVE